MPRDPRIPPSADDVVKRLREPTGLDRPDLRAKLDEAAALIDSQAKEIEELKAVLGAAIKEADRSLTDTQLVARDLLAARLRIRELEQDLYNTQANRDDWRGRAKEAERQLIERNSK